MLNKPEIFLGGFWGICPALGKCLASNTNFWQIPDRLMDTLQWALQQHWHFHCKIVDLVEAKSWAWPLAIASPKTSMIDAAATVFIGISMPHNDTANYTISSSYNLVNNPHNPRTRQCTFFLLVVDNIIRSKISAVFEVALPCHKFWNINFHPYLIPCLILLLNLTQHLLVIRR